MVAYALAWLSLHADKRAVMALEYRLVAAPIAGAITGAATTLRTRLSTQFTNIANHLTAQ